MVGNSGAHTLADDEPESITKTSKPPSTRSWSKAWRVRQIRVWASWAGTTTEKLGSLGKFT